jgi:hypothetical protein
VKKFNKSKKAQAMQKQGVISQPSEPEEDVTKLAETEEVQESLSYSYTPESDDLAAEEALFDAADDLDDE